ncbi:MAG: hypothetical protein GC155_07540 [Alphaproteobacteria bacterium]|nr:hypothetical protein [Alphaproteobacteria bacterium]
MMKVHIAAVALTLAGAALAAASPAWAQKSHATVIPTPGPGDPRIREVMYDPNQVVQLTAHLGFELPIEFDPEERIENVALGDSLSWQATPNRKATLLFLKPMAKGNPTSMTVVTNKRIYTFLLTTSASDSVNDPGAMLRVRFLYPKAAKPAATAAPAQTAAPDVPAGALNFAYSYKGAKTIEPAKVFDNGEATYFQFAEGRDTPAVFFIGTDGKEEMANTRTSGKYTIADFTAQTFVLRYGKAKLEVRNTGWTDNARGPKAPGRDH